SVNGGGDRYLQLTNLYRYSANNPVSYQDASGFSEDERSEEASRLAELQASLVFERTGEPNQHNQLIDLYEQLMRQDPDKYVGDLYPKLLSASWMRSNYSLAARYMANTPAFNRVRWALQASTIAYELAHGETSY